MNKHNRDMKADNDRRKAARKAFVVGTTVSAERFEEMIQDLLSSFDPDWIGSLAYRQSFKDKLANYIGLAERRGASNERSGGTAPRCDHNAPALEAPKDSTIPWQKGNPKAEGVYFVETQDGEYGLLEPGSIDWLIVKHYIGPFEKP